MNRRHFLGLGAAATAGAIAPGCDRKKTVRFKGGIVGASSSLGHRLRDGGFPPSEETRDVDVVVIGGGVAGLAALRRLHAAGLRNTLLLELENSVGGNAASGSNEVSAYPWGAHYVPLPNTETTEVVSLFEDLGLITGRDVDGRPIYEERALCADPMERLFTCGRWHEGLVPALGISAGDRREIAEFFATMEVFRAAVGSDGAPAFAIPMEKSSQDAQWLDLDRMTMAQWLDARNWHSPALRWHVDYCCRDDYGAGPQFVSAWAGIHYFASRRGVAAHADHDAVLTWPEGNGWLVRQMAAPLSDRIQAGCVVWKMVSEGDRGVVVEAYDAARDRSFRVQARAAVCALPRFIAQRLIPGLDSLPGLEYSPWMVANVTVDRLPEGRGASLAWDNVLRDSASLGYVVATHQSLHPVPRATVLTHYWPLDQAPPPEARRQMLGRSYEEWCAWVLDDLEKAHIGLRDSVTQLDIWLWAHGMIRPVPGFLWGGARQRMAAPHGAIYFAHSDMSGLSLFEEAYTRGVQAASDVLKLLS